MELAKIKACICEGAAEAAIIDVLKMPSVKSYDFVREYFEDSEILVQAIRKYNEISKIRKGEYTLLDLLK